MALPALEAAEHRLPWSVAFTQRLGRHGVAKRDMMAGAPPRLRIKQARLLARELDDQSGSSLALWVTCCDSGRAWQGFRYRAGDD